MKYLKIENKKGLYWDGKDYQEINKIDKDGLLELLNSAETDEFELDVYDESLFGNKAHQIIYENIYSKFKQFLSDKNQFKTEVDNLYKEAVGKYSANIQDEALDNDNITDLEDDRGEMSLEDIPF